MRNVLAFCYNEEHGYASSFEVKEDTVVQEISELCEIEHYFIPDVIWLFVNDETCPT